MAEEVKVMTPAKGKTLYVGRRKFKHGDKISPALAEKLNENFLEEWKEPVEEEKDGDDSENEE